MRPTKQQIERAIFDAVYDRARYVAIEHRDRPDFAVYRSTDRKLAFGVEITEVYTADSNARLQNIEGYFEELISGEPHRHKDDIDELKVETVTLLDKDGNVKAEGLTVIFQKMEQTHNLPALIAARIKEKNARASDYATDLTHVNLVIHDRSQNLTANLGETYPVNRFLSGEVKQALDECVFNEVHVVETDNDGVQVVRPLRALALVEAGYMFLQALKDELGTETIEISDEDGHSLFIQACRRNGLMLDYVVHETQGICAYYGGLGIHFSESGIAILDTSDFPPPSPSEIPQPTFDQETAAHLLDAHDDFVGSNSFSCAFGSRAVKSFKESFADP
jgi:hypothetical protein